MATLTSPSVETPCSAATTRFRLGDCLVDLGAATITRDGVTEALTPRTTQVLTCLVDHAGRPVSRDTLLDIAWQHRDVSDESLSRAISDLRHALGDTPRTPRYIETIPRVGYRLLATPEGLGDSLTDAPSKRQRKAWRVALSMGFVVVLVSTWLATSTVTTAHSPGGFAPLTSSPALEHSPSFGADGSRVWYVSVDGYASGHVPRSSIRVMRPDGTGLKTVLAREGDVITGLAVGPDENRVAFAADDGFLCRVLVLDRSTGAQTEIDSCGATGNVQRLAWMDDCLAYSRYLGPGRQSLAVSCPDGTTARLPAAEAAVTFHVPLAYRAEPPALLLASADGRLGLFDISQGSIHEALAPTFVRDAAFMRGNRVLALTSEGGEHTLTTLALPEFAILDRTPTVPFANFIEGAPAGDNWVLGTFDWQRRIGVLDIAEGVADDVTVPERGSFEDLSVAADGSHAVFARRGPGGWRVWSRCLKPGCGENSDALLRPISPPQQEIRIGLALPDAVLHVEQRGQALSLLVWTSLREPVAPRSIDVPFTVTALFSGPGSDFAAACVSDRFEGICHGSEDGLSPWIAGASAAAWDHADAVWYVAAGRTVSQVTPNGLLRIFELPAAQSTGRWAVHDGRVFAFTRDAASATPTLLSRSLAGPADEEIHAIDADGWNLSMSRDGRLFYTEQVYDSGTADLFISVPAG